jgi:hypothetical protein
LACDEQQRTSSSSLVYLVIAVAVLAPLAWLVL